MNKVLDILDSMEEVRQEAASHPNDFQIDHIIRLCCSIVANAYGYKSRTEWMDKLKEHPESRYAARLKENRSDSTYKEVKTMKKQTVNFAVKTENGVVKEVGRSAVLQPNPKFKGGSVKWFDDSKLVKANKA